MICIYKVIPCCFRTYFKVLGKSLQTYELDSAQFLSVHKLAWQACLKKTEFDLKLLTDADMLLMVEKDIWA